MINFLLTTDQRDELKVLVQSRIDFCEEQALLFKTKEYEVERKRLLRLLNQLDKGHKVRG